MDVEKTRGRVVEQQKNMYRVETGHGRIKARISGKLEYVIGDEVHYPAVGDYVLLDRDEDDHGDAVILEVENRTSAFVRKAAGTQGRLQVVAANIDTVFICMAMNSDFNLRRLERYLAIAWDSGAVPVVVLTKTDLCDEMESRLLEVELSSPGTDIIATSSVTEEGFDRIKKYAVKGKTIAFIGSSGVGKSTMINKLAGKQVMDTKGLRNDGKGRHATTHRQLIELPGGCYVIDTPGMRELGVETGDFSSAFADIETLAESCRFRDCSHHAEPGCAVREAVEAGRLDQKRLDNYRKLLTEASYEGMNSREREQEKMKNMFREFDGVKNAKKFVKNKRKNGF